jgi:diacylglycerol kinase family enzyme
MDRSGGAVRWDELFGDLEAQWQAQLRRELDAEVADRTRRERAAIALADRLAAQGRRVVGVALVDGTLSAVRSRRSGRAGCSCR